MADLGVEDVKISLQKFGAVDYTVFGAMLFSCSLIGIYFGFVQSRSKSIVGDAANYLVGGRNMAVFPIAMSLIASFISGITLLGTPTEIYLYGIQYMYIVFGVLTMGFVMSNIYLPVFHDLKLTSTYEYLQTRFDRRLRLFGSILFIVGTMAWLPIVIYVPALAFNQVTGTNVHWITPFVCVVCIFYTCVGGLKAVVWTDVVQTILMFGAMVLIIVKGTLDVGGVQTIWSRALASNRIELPDSTFDLRSRHTIWSLFFGGFVYWLKSNAVSQNMIQRYLSLPTLADARKALWSFIVGVLILLGLCCYAGLLIYATFHDCDPLTTKLIKAKDQLLPLLVMRTLGDLPGLPGLFVAGVFSAALSSLSTGLNSMSAVVLEDFFKPFVSKPLTEMQTKYVTRGVVIVLGSICVCLVFVVERLGAVLQLSMSLGAVTNGPLLGIFTMAVLMPWVHGSGALIGGSTGLAFMMWICVRAQQAIAMGELHFATKPISTVGCDYHFGNMSALLGASTSMPALTVPLPEPEFAIYHISYLWYTLVGASITICVALVASFVLGSNDPHQVDAHLLAPCIRRFVRPTPTSILHRETTRPDEPAATEDDIRYASTFNIATLTANSRV